MVGGEGRLRICRTRRGCLTGPRYTRWARPEMTPSVAHSGSARLECLQARHPPAERSTRTPFPLPSRPASMIWNGARGALPLALALQKASTAWGRLVDPGGASRAHLCRDLRAYVRHRVGVARRPSARGIRSRPAWCPGLGPHVAPQDEGHLCAARARMPAGAPCASRPAPRPVVAVRRQLVARAGRSGASIPSSRRSPRHTPFVSPPAERARTPLLALCQGHGTPPPARGSLIL